MERAQRGQDNVVTLERKELPVAREEYAQAIQLWCKNRDVADTLSREEIGSMQAFDRIDAQRKALILNLIHYFRQHERADVAPGVAVIIHLMSDNDKGASTVSQATMAKLFNRSASSIADANRRLKEDRIIVAGRGRYPMTYPVIPKAVAKSYNHLSWLLAAAADTSEKPLNLPAPPEDCQSSGPAGGLTQIPDGSGELKSVNPPVEGNSILRPDPIQLHYKNSTTLKRAASVVASGIATAAGITSAAAYPPDPPAIVQPARMSLADMNERMLDAAGKALANPAGAMGLLTFSELQRWLDGGCDFETDILQTIRAAAARQPPGSIKTWKYFTQAIADAKATREAPMPKGEAKSRGGFKTQEDRQKSTDDAWFERELAAAQKEGLL